MRIGILTFHSAHNYGAVLQCYALQEYLTSLGHQVEVIDYRNPSVMNCYKCFNPEVLKRKNPYRIMQNLYHEIKFYRVKKQRSAVFTKFINTRLNLAPTNTIQENPYDLIVVGSDQVWNYNLTNGFDPFYWGDFTRPTKTKLASYAASMQDSWPDALDVTISRKLNNFDYISTRELSIANKLKAISPNKQISQVLDPTILFSSNQWDRIAEKPSINEPYLLLYQVNSSEKAVAIAKHIAEERNLRLVYLSAESEGINSSICTSASPEVFVGLFKYAAFVVCSSFHGTVFSLLYQKSFYSVKGAGKNARVETLLSSIGMLDRFVDTIPEHILDIKYKKNVIVGKSTSIAFINNLIGGNE